MLKQCINGNRLDASIPHAEDEDETAMLFDFESLSWSV